MTPPSLSPLNVMLLGCGEVDLDGSVVAVCDGCSEVDLGGAAATERVEIK